MLAEGLERDLRLRRQHAVDLVELIGDDLGDVVDLAHAHHREEVEVSRHGVDLADAVDVGDLLGSLRDA